LGCIGYFQIITTNAFKYISIEQNIANATLLKRGKDPIFSIIDKFHDLVVVKKTFETLIIDLKSQPAFDL